MGRHKTESLIYQVEKDLLGKLATGESKYLAKIDGTFTQKIYSYETLKSYLKHCCYFVRWCKEQPIDPSLGHKPRTLEECRIFAEKWIQYNIDRGLSAYTAKLQISALAKLYGCSTKDFDVKTPARKRANIKRSRGDVIMDKHFSIERNKELITFCKCTGLRRAEFEQIRGTDLIEHEGKLCLDVHKGTKGGRLRVSEIIGSDEEIETVKKHCAEEGEGKVFLSPNTNADIHSYRANYAQRIYDANKREYKDFKNERLIIYKNKVYDSYITKNGRRDASRYPELYRIISGRRRMLSGYRDFCIAWRSLGACLAKKDTPKAAPIIPPRAPQATVIAAVTFLLTGVNTFTTLQTTYANVANKAALAIPHTSLANHFPFESALFVGELRQYADKL